MSVGSLCSGYEGAGLALGEVPTWVADNDPDAAKVLAHRFPDVPNLGDITKADWHDVEPVDVLTAGYPCQPFSHAGKRKGSDDSRHIWPFVARAVGVLRPGVVFLENVAGHVSLGLDAVLADLAALGYDATWGVIRAADAGAPHTRARVFIFATDTDAAAHPDWRRREQCDPQQRHLHVPDPDRTATWGPFAPAIARWERITGRRAPDPRDDRGRLNPRLSEWLMGLPAGWVCDVPSLSKTAQLRLLGNGIVPQQAALAWRVLNQLRAAA